jgi:protein phosphatase 1 regulatory subunit 11
VTDTHPSPDQNEGASGSEPPFAVLRLRGGPVSRRRVVWDEEVVDNEHLGRKSSKSEYPLRRE